MLVISAFPGCGKTELTKAYPDHYIDLDMPEVKDMDVYLNAIKEAGTSGKTVLVPSWQALRDVIVAAGMDVVLVHPTFGMKEEMLERYRKRGSSPKLIETMERRYDEFLIDTLTAHGGFPNVRNFALTPNTYLTHAVGLIKADIPSLAIRACVRYNEDLKCFVGDQGKIATIDLRGMDWMVRSAETNDPLYITYRDFGAEFEIRTSWQSHAEEITGSQELFCIDKISLVLDSRIYPMKGFNFPIFPGSFGSMIRMVSHHAK